MNEFFTMPKTFGEMIDNQVKFAKSMIDLNVQLMKAYLEVFTPQKS